MIVVDKRFRFSINRRKYKAKGVTPPECKAFAISLTPSPLTRKARQFKAGFPKTEIRIRIRDSKPRHNLPSALLMPVRLKPLAALVLRHLETTFLFEIAHG